MIKQLDILHYYTQKVSYSGIFRSCFSNKIHTVVICD